MLTRNAIQRIIRVLKMDNRRAMRMRLKGFPKPYYCGLVLRDTEWFNTWAGSGSTYRRRSDHKRHVYADIRVGSPRYDQISCGGLLENEEEADSFHYVRVPIDDRNYGGLRLAVWRLTETKFKEALAAYSHKEAKRISKVDPTETFRAFTPLPPLTSLHYPRRERIDEDSWVMFCRTMSHWMSTLPQVSSSFVEFESLRETKILVNSEKRTIVQNRSVYSLIATLKKLTKEGVELEQELVITTGALSELPSVREFKNAVRKKHQQLLQLIRARQIHAFSGPVLLAPGPAGLLFHEAIGHRLEGSRLLSAGEGQTFKGQIGKRVIPGGVTIRDNPLLDSFNGTRCVGAYHFDDEGTPAKDTLLVEEGILRDFLSTRSSHDKVTFVPNGHARNEKHERPISRMGVTMIQGKTTASFGELKKLLQRELVRQKRPFGMIVYETSGGETETTSYDFQAFAGEISFATLLYPDGREEVVRGVNFVGTPLQALNNILAVGDTLEVDNGYCGAESGFIPVTTISPAILLRSLELQAKEEELVTQNILAKPRW